MDKAVTIAQIARESGVSIATVSRVINDLSGVAPETKKRVEAVLKKHRYTSTAFARGTGRRQSMTIGIIMPDIANPYFAAMFQEFEAAAREKNYSVFLCNTAFYSCAGKSEHEKDSQEAEFFQMMLDKHADGVLVVGGQTDLPQVGESFRAALQRLASHIPVVVLGNKVEGIDCTFIQRETGHGVFLAMNYLTMLGHGRIAFIGGETGVGITSSRLSSYLDALKAYGIGTDEGLIVTSDYYTPDGYSAMKELLRRGVDFTAFLAVNDNVAFGAYRALADAGLQIPKDISAISCDQFFSAEYFVPRLTSIDQHNEDFGRFVIHTLLNDINNVQKNEALSVTPELIIRESCEKPKRQRKEIY